MRKKIIYITLFFLITTTVVIVIILAQYKYRNLYLDNVEINIKPDNRLVDESNIFEILEDNNIVLDSNVLIKNVKLNKIEKTLEKNPYIENVSVFSKYENKKMNLIINVNLISPLVRVIAKDKSQFYIDKNANIVDIFANKNFSLPILIANDFEKAVFDSLFIDSLLVKKKNLQEFDRNELMSFLKYINKSEFWKNQIDQITINKNRDKTNEIEIEIFTRIGRHRVIMGTLENYSFKLNKLLSLYKEVLLKEKNWNKFSEINLKYSDQINCK